LRAMIHSWIILPVLMLLESAVAIQTRSEDSWMMYIWGFFGVVGVVGVVGRVSARSRRCRSKSRRESL